MVRDRSYLCCFHLVPRNHIPQLLRGGCEPPWARCMFTLADASKSAPLGPWLHPGNWRHTNRGGQAIDLMLGISDHLNASRRPIAMRRGPSRLVFVFICGLSRVSAPLAPWPARYSHAPCYLAACLLAHPTSSWCWAPLWGGGGGIRSEFLPCPSYFAIPTTLARAA